MSWEWGVRIMAFGLIGVLAFTQIFMPAMTMAQSVPLESFSTLDCIAAYTKLQGSAAAISPYIMTAPRGLRGELIAAQGRWYITAKSIVCGTAVGESFMTALVYSNYLEKHATDCVFPNACVALRTCTDAGKTILVPGINEEQKKAVMQFACLDCLQVANYLLQKNQHMAKQAESSEGELTSGWTKFPP